jgi:hypothetical protein
MQKKETITPLQREALQLIAEGRFYPTLTHEDDGWHARWHAVGIENAWIDEYVRRSSMTRLTEDAEDQKHETLHDAWMMALSSRSGLVIWDEDECAQFAKELTSWNLGAEGDVKARRALTFTFSPDKEAFSIICPTPTGRRLLKSLGQAVSVYSPLCGLRKDSAKPELLRVILDKKEAESFIRKGANDLGDAGYNVEGVDITATITAEADIESDGSTAKDSQVRASDAKIRLKIKVAGEVVSANEIRFLLDQGSSLVFFRDRWIEVDRAILKEALRALEKTSIRKLDPIVFSLGIGHVGKLEITNAQASGGIGNFINNLLARGGSAYATMAEPQGFKGVLRDYQRDGMAWLSFMTNNGFGALLADDMGLGKTIQVIAWLLSEREKKASRAPALVVAPLTLLENWSREVATFAPELSVYIHQGERRHIASGFRKSAISSDIVVTSYNLLVKDYQAISEVEWSALILDEAQYIKNSDTRASRAARALSPAARIALTGTPIENSVLDLWSLEEFLNPGLLGNKRSFTDRFAKQIAADGNGTAAKRLRKAMEPFVMRRLKTDKSIAAQIGEKREIREYCPLGLIESRAYETALSNFRFTAHEQGDIFALLTRLKLICDGFDGEKVSGAKAERLAELSSQLIECGESAIVFTQYAKVGAALKAFLQERLGINVQFLHGALDATARAKQIAQFQSSLSPGIIILSLRAGGVGVNLTKATHVIHYDRWWNPAVENQATDRAHRIGQSKNVFVHLFISSGTIEERVDEILQRKESLREIISDASKFRQAALLSSTAHGGKAQKKIT